MNYKLCEYLLPWYNKNKDLLLYNTLYGNVVLIKKKTIPQFVKIREKVLTAPSTLVNDKNISLLVKAHVLVEDDNAIRQKLNLVYKDVFENDSVLNFTILPTEKCNFRCVYCYEDFKIGKMGKNIVEHTELLMAKILTGYKSLAISWFGGEPLLAMDVIESISTKALTLCRELKIPFWSRITTNGYLLNDFVVRQLIKWHVLLYQVTIDGNPTTHNRQRPLLNGENTYETILENLLKIRNNIKSQMIKIIIRVNVSEEVQASDINRIFNLFKDDKRFVINPQPIFETENYKPSRDSRTTYFDKLSTCGVDVESSFSPEDTICYAAKQNSLMIRANGSIGKCTVNLDDSNNYFGNVLSVNMADIRTQDFIYSNSLNYKVECQKCPVYPLCFGKQCPARKHQSCGEILKKYSILVRSLEKEACVINFE